MGKLTEWMLKLGGHEIWPPTHGDPRIKGPQPRIITKRQKEWLEQLQTSGNPFPNHHENLL